MPFRSSFSPGITFALLFSSLASLTGCRSQPSSTVNQATRLEQEGVEVTRGALGELFVSFDQYGWFPSALPSEAGQDHDDDDNDDNE